MLYELYRDLLVHAVSYKTISTVHTPEYRNGINGCVKWLTRLFEREGFSVQTFSRYGNPVIIASYHTGTKPRCLVYGHYDTVSSNDWQKWRNNPWQVTEQDDRLHGLGVVDNKGQFLLHLATALYLKKIGELAYDMTFVLEGDEETGSPHMERFIREHSDLLAADFVLVSDGEGAQNGTPIIECMYRGGFNLTVDIAAADTDYHSGLDGGLGQNAADCAARLAVYLRDLVPNSVHTLRSGKKPNPLTTGIYWPPAEDVPNDLMPWDPDLFTEMYGALPDSSIANPTISLAFLPSLEVTTFKAGYMGDNYQNAVPATATLKCNVRCPYTQSANDCLAALSEGIYDALPHIPRSRITISHSQTRNGVRLNTDHPHMHRLQEIIRVVYGEKAPLRACGASVPAVTYFSNLGLPMVVVSPTNADAHIHSPNENFSLYELNNALVLSRMFLEK